MFSNFACVFGHPFCLCNVIVLFIFLAFVTVCTGAFVRSCVHSWGFLGSWPSVEKWAWSPNSLYLALICDRVLSSPLFDFCLWKVYGCSVSQDTIWRQFLEMLSGAHSPQYMFSSMSICHSRLYKMDESWVNCCCQQMVIQEALVIGWVAVEQTRLYC